MHSFCRYCLGMEGSCLDVTSTTAEKMRWKFLCMVLLAPGTLASGSESTEGQQWSIQPIVWAFSAALTFLFVGVVLAMCVKLQKYKGRTSTQYISVISRLSYRGRCIKLAGCRECAQPVPITAPRYTRNATSCCK